MPVLSSLKEALGTLARLSAGYSPEVIQQKQALARLGEVDLRGRLLDNEAKLERMKQSREQAALAAREVGLKNLDRAADFQSEVPSMEDPRFVGPRLEDIGVLNAGGEGLLPGYDAIPEAFGIEEEMRPIVRAAGEARRTERRRKEDMEQGKWEMGMREAASRVRENDEQADWYATRGARVQRSTPSTIVGPDGKVIHGKDVIFTDSSVKFVPNPDGSRPLYGADTPQQDRNSLVGYRNNISNLETVLSNFERAAGEGLLGPIQGRWSDFNARYFGGRGLSAEQRVLMQSLDRARTMAAFESGGKALTGTEKQFFDDNYPTLKATNDPKVFAALAKGLIAVFKREHDKRLRAVPQQRRQDFEFLEGGESPAAPEAEWVVDRASGTIKRRTPQ